MTLEEKLQNLPPEPGVYLMKDRRGHIIYVGKALSLKNRVRSYFQKGTKGEKTEMLVRAIADLETIVTHTELEALILESTLIKKHHPRFNIVLRDDKNYPYLRLDLKVEYPRIEVVRGLKKDGSIYYGPYVPAGGMWEILSLIRRTFPLATCKKEFKKDKPERPCVQHQIGRCLAPCSGEVDKDAYHDMVGQVRLFIEGKNRDLIDLLKQRMEKASEGMEYERAAELRDRIAKIEGAFEGLTEPALRALQDARAAEEQEEEAEERGRGQREDEEEAQSGGEGGQGPEQVGHEARSSEVHGEEGGKQEAEEEGEERGDQKGRKRHEAQRTKETESGTQPEDATRGNLAPESFFPVQDRAGRGGAERRGEHAHSRADHQVDPDTRFIEGLQDSRMIGARRTTARKHNRGAVPQEMVLHFDHYPAFEAGR